MSHLTLRTQIETKVKAIHSAIDPKYDLKFLGCEAVKEIPMNQPDIDYDGWFIVGSELPVSVTMGVELYSGEQTESVISRYTLSEDITERGSFRTIEPVEILYIKAAFASDKVRDTVVELSDLVDNALLQYDAVGDSGECYLGVIVDGEEYIGWAKYAITEDKNHAIGTVILLNKSIYGSRD